MRAGEVIVLSRSCSSRQAGSALYYCTIPLGIDRNHAQDWRFEVWAEADKRAGGFFAKGSGQLRGKVNKFGDEVPVKEVRALAFV